MAYRLKKNTYYLGGFKRLDVAARRYLCIAAIGQQPLENFVLKLLKDDRFLRNAVVLKASLMEDVDIAHDLPLYIFGRLAKNLRVRALRGCIAPP